MKISLDLTAKQERYLIQLGLASLADQAIGGARTSRPSNRGGQRWSAAQRRKFITTMTKVRAAKKRGHAKPNGRALMNGTAHTSAAKGLAMRADGKGPLKQPGKKWTAAHRRNFIASYKKTLAAKKRAAASSTPKE